MELAKFKLIEQANEIGSAAWEEVIHWKYFEKDTVGKQLVRAADSISANLSEAYGRYSYQDRKRFAYYARGSLCETINWINKAARRNMIAQDIANALILKLNDMSFKLNAYIKSLKQFN